MSRSRVSYLSRKKRCVSSSITSMSSPSSETMCTSTEDCFCHEQVRQSPSPYSWYAQRISSSADIVSSWASLSLSMLTQQDLFEGVGAEPEPQGLERDHLVGR